VVAAIFLLVTSSLAQSPAQSRTTAKKTKRGPRAIAVLEFLPGGKMRLVPIALLMDGKYYDASLYAANPVPMAVEPQTVYEAQSFGEPTGTFTIASPMQVNGSWVADGSWRPHLAMDEKAAAQAAKDAANKPKSNPSKVVTTGDAESGRPVLKRAPGSAGDSAGSSQPAQSSTPSDPNRPTMKRPPGDSSSNPPAGQGSDSASTSTTASAKTPAQGDDHDPDRPVMKHPAAPAPSANSTSSGDSTAINPAAAASNDNDPNRPMLSRTNTPRKQNQASSDLAPEKVGTPVTAPIKGARAYPAISDAGDYHGRPMLYAMSPGERQIQEQQVLKLALAEIQAFAAKRNGPAIPKTAAITDYDVRAYDLDYSSSPTIVLTAKLPIKDTKAPPDFSYFVTMVARVDINDQAQKLFVSVTDTRHLDAYPRLELIDALDADANGRGDLLFRQYSDSGISYGLYRVSAYQVEKVFEGGSAL
jgi:hypothetical protein